MTIYDLVPSHLRAGGPLRVRDGDGPSKKEAPKPVLGAERGDKVEISPEGRILASQSHLADGTAEGLSSERLEEIQGRMEDGTYDSPEVALEVARQLLESGDLEL